jgi:hypothetical protein
LCIVCKLCVYVAVVYWELALAGGQ